MIPPFESFGPALLPRAATHRSLRRLHELCAALDSRADLHGRCEQLVALAGWVRARGAPPVPDGAEPGENAAVLRLRLLVSALERFPELATRLRAVLSAVFVECSGLELFSRSGIPADRGLLGETMDRLSRRFLPEPVDARELGQLVARLFPAKRDVVWLTSVPPSLVGRFAATLRAPNTAPGAQDTGIDVQGATISVLASARPWTELERTAFDALALIAQRVAGVGLYDAIRARSPRVPLRGSPFFLLPRATEALIERLVAGERTGIEAAVDACRLHATNSLDTVVNVTQNLEQSGVSVDVVYRLELITKNLERFRALLDCIVESDPTSRADAGRRLCVRLLEARRNERDLGQIVTSNLHLLARKIIERAGQTGEHYITTTRREFAGMFFSACGGGVLTAGTTALKYLISSGQFAPFVEGFLASTNYAGTFLLMQLLGFTLATKQPSMTAAALAHSMHTTAGQQDLTGLVTLIARSTRSQLAAACGNVGAVIPSALLFNVYYQHRTGHAYLDADYAEHVLESLHPTRGGTALYAALTGVLLWASSVGAGWLENWAVYRRLPEAIAQHRSGRFLGRRTTAWASRAFARNISGIGGNLTAGFLLGMTPVVGKFFGLPLEVRHVTLSTGALTLAACARGAEVLHEPAFHAAMLGIAVIFVMNLCVSFVLALAVALRAREVAHRDRLRMWASVFVTFFRSPAQFFFPPRSANAEKVHGPVTAKPPPVH